MNLFVYKRKKPASCRLSNLQTAWLFHYRQSILAFCSSQAIVMPDYMLILIKIVPVTISIAPTTLLKRKISFRNITDIIAPNKELICLKAEAYDT
jgi:hypothetical protein